MIIALKQYLSTAKQASLLNLAQTFDVDPKLMRDLIHCWVKRGRIRQIPASKACGSSCGNCAQACASIPDEYYEWV